MVRHLTSVLIFSLAVPVLAAAQKPTEPNLIERVAALETRLAGLETQNTGQQSAIAALQASVTALQGTGVVATEVVRSRDFIDEVAAWDSLCATGGYVAGPNERAIVWMSLTCPVGDGDFFHVRPVRFTGTSSFDGETIGGDVRSSWYVRPAALFSTGPDDNWIPPASNFGSAVLVGSVDLPEGSETRFGAQGNTDNAISGVEPKLDCTCDTVLMIVKHE